MNSNSDIDTLWPIWYPKVYGYFYKRVENKIDVEDLTAISMQSAFSAKSVKNFQAYMWRVCHNNLANFIRNKSKQPIFVEIIEDADSNNHEALLIDLEVDERECDHYKQKVADLKKCVENQLPKEELEVVNLCIYEEKNSTEVGQVLNIKPATIRKRLSRILQKLREKCRQLWIN